MYKVLLSLFISCFGVLAQGSRADCERSFGLIEKARTSGFATAGPATFINKSPRFWYRRGNDFVIVDANTGAKSPAFDHARLAAALSTATGAE